MSFDIPALSAAGLARRIRERELSPVTVVDTLLNRIEARNDRTNAFVTVADTQARQAAQRAEAALQTSDPIGPLHGVPVAVKDINDVAGLRTTKGSKLFEDSIAEKTDPFVQRLQDAGAIVIGKTNTPEFALGCTTDNRVIGPTTTPFDLDRTAGGSSGGAGAALADGLVPLAQGSDTGGSIRTPASFCGVYGFKPSFGRVPRTDARNSFNHHTPFRHIGPMARTVEDAALMLEIMSGSHPHDPFSLPSLTTDYRDAIQQSVRTLSVAYTPDLGVYPVSSTVRDIIDDAVMSLQTAGVQVDRVDPPLGDLSHETILDAYYVFVTVLWEGLLDALAEDGIDVHGPDRELLAESTVETILDADEVTTRDLNSANRVRTQVFKAIQEVFTDYDLLVTPTLAVPPFEVGNPPTEIEGIDIDPQRGWLLTQPFNMTGHPAASIPAGFTDNDLPVGLQLVGKRHADADVLAMSAAFERTNPWHDRYPM